MLYPIIDIGSNTVKLSVLDSEKIFAPAPVFFKAAPLKLRARVQDNCLLPDAVEELCDLLLSYRDIAARLTATPPLAFATASLRGLDNAEEVLSQIHAACGIEVDLIAGKDEAFYSFLGARATHRYKSGIVVDLGGGSTELVLFRGKRVLHCTSLPFGCLTLTNAFFDGKTDFEGCREFILHHLRKSAPKTGGKELLISGGSAKAALKYKNTLKNKKNSHISTRSLEMIRNHYLSGDEKEKAFLADTLKERFHLIPAAVTVFATIAAFYRKDGMIVAKSGVREGYLSHYLKKQNKKF